MSFLGDIGSLYMLVLIALLIVGFGMIAKGFFCYLLNLESNKVKGKESEKSVSGSWFKISMYSLAGILISLLILSFLPSTGTGEHVATVSQSTAKSSAHEHGTSTSSMGATGMSNISNSGNLNSNNTSGNNDYQLQQQLSQMQNQINQLQSLIQNMSGVQSTAP